MVPALHLKDLGLLDLAAGHVKGTPALLDSATSIGKQYLLHKSLV